MLFISDYIYWIVVGPCHAWSSMSIWGGLTEWLFVGGKKIIDFVCTYIWFQCIINIESYLLSLYHLELEKSLNKRSSECVRRASSSPLSPSTQWQRTSRDLFPSPCIYIGIRETYLIHIWCIWHYIFDVWHSTYDIIG